MILQCCSVLILRGKVFVWRDASVHFVQLPPPLRKTLDDTTTRAPKSALHGNWMRNTFCNNGPNRTPTDTAAGASSPDEHTYLGVRSSARRSSARRNLALDGHLREARGGKSHAQDKGSASCTHAYTYPVQAKVHHCKQISNSVGSNQRQSKSIRLYQGFSPACYPSWDTEYALPYMRQQSVQS